MVPTCFDEGEERITRGGGSRKGLFIFPLSKGMPKKRTRTKGIDIQIIVLYVSIFIFKN